MEIIEKVEQPAAVTIGKFEALHLGHMSMINAVEQYSKQNGLCSAVVSFTPNPVKILFDPDYKQLLTEKEKAYLLNISGVDFWVPYRFDYKLAGKTPNDFFYCLKKEINFSAVLVGEDFRFGKNREGTVKSLIEFGMNMDINIVTVPYLSVTGSDYHKISTSQIRDYLCDGKIKEANQLLGKPFFIMETVKKGRQLGRSIGFPTANLHPPEDKLLPPNGVYAANVIVKGKKYSGITNIGFNPTVSEKQIPKAETFIFNFNEDIYDEEIIVELLDFIRYERTFNGLGELKAQIKSDTDAVQKATSFLSGFETGTKENDASG